MQICVSIVVFDDGISCSRMRNGSSNDQFVFLERVDAKLHEKDRAIGIFANVIGMLGDKTSGAPSSSVLVQQISAMLASSASGGGVGGLMQSFDREGLGSESSDFAG